jgi:hypothetical protein
MNNRRNTKIDEDEYRLVKAGYDEMFDSNEEWARVMKLNQLIEDNENKQSGGEEE